MTNLARRLALMERAAHARRLAELATMSDEQLAALQAENPPEFQAWLERMSDDDLTAIMDSTPRGRELLATAPECAP